MNPSTALALAVAFHCAACFQPQTSGFRCADDGLCPPGLRCSPEGFCVGSGEADAAANSDAGANCSDWDALYFDPCALPSPAAFPADAVLIDTIAGTVVTESDSIALPTLGVGLATGETATVIVVTSFDIGANRSVRVVGDSPLIVASFGAVSIVGTLDASIGGAGAGVLCGGVAGDPAGGLFGAGGAGHGQAGADGGAPAGGGGGAIGGSSRSDDELAGGCPGGSSEADGGAGGGAVWLSSPASIRIDGAVDASGAGGFGGVPTMGVAAAGGGGGSGGFIGLEAPLVDGSGVIAANGGGGGSGSTVSVDGQDGSAGLLLTTRTPPAGAPFGAGDGGAGGARDGEPTDGGNGTILDAAGGGGGGGAGKVRARGTLANSLTVSPAAQ